MKDITGKGGNLEKVEAKKTEVLLTDKMNIEDDCANWLMVIVYCCLKNFGGRVVVYKSKVKNQTGNYIDVMSEELYLSLKEELEEPFSDLETEIKESEFIYTSEYIEPIKEKKITDQLILNATYKIIKDIEKNTSIKLDKENLDLKFLYIYDFRKNFWYSLISFLKEVALIFLLVMISAILAHLLFLSLKNIYFINRFYLGSILNVIS